MRKNQLSEDLTMRQNRILHDNWTPLAQISQSSIHSIQIAQISLISQIAHIVQIANIAHITQAAHIAQIVQISQIAQISQILQIAQIADVTQIEQTAQPSHLSNLQQNLQIGHFLSNLTSVNFQNPILWLVWAKCGIIWPILTHNKLCDIVAVFWPIILVFSERNLGNERGLQHRSSKRGLL